ncbi:MAG TPA: methylated-DNA--[protein]-cysteine S-methyltransferase [Halanaerobiaceae bacterium]|jgi:methylated-DNA-[protein]-cysteine S-methyltransferase|nr:methylated-DNA--[protein]-cysteine S-methyltransferase [Bacillota bacterium]HHU93220.1 methylated-DNA--[protein]-cysteine S-methyltransferase [Halanaerobiaceae bacterium]HOA40908.1 methylated-DNA--[protein]-cysteine S-methyltransferase [Halanaerobiales bacterium]HPZ62506.1 methylated-DNA--[protein]-cysteine S-methyltransferase [Halanaerobiales bacterium]HQD03725.1 methylated-DNA--[protein]-cysteine S-methyltransferase [Halanaerobiales bacterium]
MDYSYFNYPSPIGILKVRFTAVGILGISFSTAEQNKNCKDEYLREEDLSLYKYIFDELNAYFMGKLRVFQVPLILEGTDFQKRVWKEIMKIPYGEVASYGEIARAIGVPKGARAVGNANNKNKVPIIIPCHRVVGSNGSLTGYAGGLERKKWLIAHENKYRKD